MKIEELMKTVDDMDLGLCIQEQMFDERKQQVISVLKDACDFDDEKLSVELGMHQDEGRELNVYYGKEWIGGLVVWLLQKENEKCITTFEKIMENEGLSMNGPMYKDYDFVIR